VSQCQKGKTNLDFSKARDSEWQWHQLGYMQVCTSLQIDNHASTLLLSYLQAGCPSCRPTNSVKALKANGPQEDAEKSNEYCESKMAVALPNADRFSKFFCYQFSSKFVMALLFVNQIYC